MKPRGVSWILAVAIGIFVILAISLSVLQLPDYSIRLQQSKAVVFDWFASSGLIDQAGDAEYEDASNSVEIQVGSDGEIPISGAQAPSLSGNEAADIPPIRDNIIKTDNVVESSSSQALVNRGDEAGGEGDEQQEEACDIYSGNWVRDESYPLFQPYVCPFLDTGFRCVENGRTDIGFLQWRWQPSGCNLPRFNATDMLRILRGKRVVVVGDSLGRNQWESLVCMLYQGVSNRSNVYEARKQVVFGKSRKSYSMIFSDYKVIVEYYRSHYLVVENRRPPGIVKRRYSCSLTLDRLDRNQQKWMAGDFIIFNSGHWWTHTKVKSGKCYFIEGSNFTTNMNVMEAYEKSLKTWADWVDMLPSGKRVFFRGFAPSHFSGGGWDTGGTCDKHTQPLEAVAKLGEASKKIGVVEKVISDMKTPVTFLNVTYLTMFRKDGHVANWGRPKGDDRQDCSHWCLPGVPDTWNYLLYAAMLR